ncbi:hypothetical protein [Streptomyces sp. NBC_00859]|uniref:hypothetical protein n=1 Tax=Streptomyces sp. NBC_00859 TaxID=2903682 RepID=UPI003866CE62|nr:hypothetical protein OG584_24845 [Streptomyces sp. NBC_00859]
MSSDTLVRCSDGHLFTAKWVPLVGLRSVRLGPTRRYARCPVGKHWCMTHAIAPATLTDAEVSRASEHNAGLQ